MNPETSISDIQIAAIFERYELAIDPVVKRITLGFTNEIHQVNEYIMKVYIRKDGEKNFVKESNFYKSLAGKALTPKLVIADISRSIIDKPFIIYEMISGNPLGSVWHTLNNEQRKAIVGDVCNQLRIIRASNPKPRLESGKSWQDQIISAIHEHLDVVREKQLLNERVISSLNHFIDTYKHVLKKEEIELTYWDLHLDNLIVNENGKLVGIIDFEHVDVVSIDYLLNIVRQLVRYPHLTLGQEMEEYARKDDYQYLMGWLQEYYPEIFGFPELERRIDFYELEGILRLLPRFPQAQQIHDRISLMLEKA